MTATDQENAYTYTYTYTWQTDLIKIMATGGVRTAGTNPAESAFSLREVEAAATAAASAGLRLAAHAHGVDGIANAARAGAHTIEHCSWVNANGYWGQYKPEVVQLIAQRGVYVCPTIGASPALMNARLDTCHWT